MTLTNSGYSVGETFFWYGKILTIKQIDGDIHYDNFGQRHVVVLANDNKTYWLRAN